MVHDSSSGNGVEAGSSRDSSDEVRDIHALTPQSSGVLAAGGERRREAWETGSQHRSSSLSVASEGASSENFTSMSREFNALVLAGSVMEGRHGREEDGASGGRNMGRIGEEELEETNPLAIVPDSTAPPYRPPSPRQSLDAGVGGEVPSVLRVKKEEVESKISAWQTAKVAKINNRFKREDAIISGWESEEVQKATTWMKKVERKLEEKRAKALEKMQNDIARARRKSEEKRASAEAKRGTKVARVLELANLMRAVGRAPAKRSVF